MSILLDATKCFRSHHRWTPEATVLRLLRLCQQAELVENGFTPNNAMLYAFTNKMKKMKQKKFQSFPKVQRRRTRVGIDS